MVWKHFLGLKHVKAELFLQSQSPGTVPQLGTDIVGWKPWMMVQDQAECQTERHCILMHFVCCVLKWMDWEWQWGAHVLAIREAALSDFDGLLWSLGTAICCIFQNMTESFDQKFFDRAFALTGWTCVMQPLGKAWCGVFFFWNLPCFRFSFKWEICFVIVWPAVMWESGEWDCGQDEMEERSVP